jgi:DNA polymerase-1
VVELFRELGLTACWPNCRSRKEQLPGPPQCRSENSRKKLRTVTGVEALSGLTERLKGAGSLAISTAGSSLNPIAAHIVGLAVSPAPGESYYIPVAQGDAPAAGQIPLNSLIEYFKPLLEDPAPAKIIHNAKYDLILLAQNGISLNNLKFDTMLAAHLLSDKSLSLKDVVFNRMGIEIVPASDLVGSGAKQIPCFR